MKYHLSILTALAVMAFDIAHDDTTADDVTSVKIGECQGVSLMKLYNYGNYQLWLLTFADRSSGEPKYYKYSFRMDGDTFLAMSNTVLDDDRVHEYELEELFLAVNHVYSFQTAEEKARIDRENKIRKRFWEAK